MTVISSEKDVEGLTLTFVVELDAPVERVWQLWSDPRQLERWWGPPTWPATFDRFEFEPGGHAAYYMTGPDGEKAPGWWVITAIDEPNRIEFDDGFADENREPVADMGTVHGVVTLEAAGAGTRMSIRSSFETAEQLEQMVQMGMEEGMREGLGQMDAILAEPLAEPV